MGRRMVLGMTLLLAGCVSSGIKVPQEELVRLEKGVTLCVEVVARFGQPTSSTLRSDGTRELTYTYQQAQAKPENFIPFVGAFMGGATTEMTQAHLYCNAQGVLLDYESTQGQMQSGTGLISGGRQ